MPINQDLLDSLRVAVAVGMHDSIGLPGREVKVKNSGRALVADYFQDAQTKRPTMRLRDEGETYWVCCPNCRDTRYRLCVNHRWGVLDERTGSHNWWMVHCFNEECQSHVDGFAFMLRDRISRLNIRAMMGDVQPTAGKVVEFKGGPAGVIQTPGQVVPVAELADDHPVRVFLRGDGHDPDLLSKHYGVGFCSRGNYAFTEHRVIFPVIEEEVTVGWQARYVDIDGNGKCGNVWHCRTCRSGFRFLGDARPTCYKCNSTDVESVPKYWTSPGFRKGYHLYNYDRARWSKFGIITEGPKNVIHLGSPSGPDLPGPGVALFGHTASRQQSELIWRAWRTGAVVVLLDPDADAQRCQRELVEELKGSVFKVASVVLADGKDIKQVPHRDLWLQIIEQSKAQGVDLLGL